MRRWPLAARAGLTALAVAAFALAVAVVLREPPRGGPALAVLDRYCIGCHNDAERPGGISFERLDRARLDGHTEVWENAVRMVRTGLMPPYGEPRPDRAERDAFVSELEGGLDEEWHRNPRLGARALARLNRNEYANSIRDLLAFDGRAIASALPPDATVDGFDNIADALAVSPTLLEGYATAAMQVSRRAVGDRSMGHGETRYRALPGAAQQTLIEGLPLGTRGGLAVEHTFPLDAEYEFSVAASIPRAGWNNPTATLVYCDGPRIDVTFNGAPVDVEDPRRFRLRVAAGPQRIAVALVDERRCSGVNELYQGEVGLAGAVQSLTIIGPFSATGTGDTPSRREIFGCRPQSAAEETPCAKRILARLGTRAYRRPVTEDSSELAELMRFYAIGRDESRDFEVGIQYALSRLLVDPKFLFRFEREPAEAAVGTLYSLDDFELASRLSFFLWSSIPDDELLAVAAEGRLHGAALEEQVDRLLADARSRALVDNFAGQWLELRTLDEVVPQDPGFDEQLRAAMRRETELVFADLLAEPRSVKWLLDADYTYLDERLAEHYGVADVRGSYPRRVQWPAESPRRGLLGHGSILTATSAPNRTSPVVRGQWIMQSLLGARIPAPPPGAEADLSAEASESEQLVGDTVRARLEMHRANPSCAGCHGIMDPLGLALENFDLLGRWRDTEDGHAIDAKARLVDGTELDGARELREVLVARSDLFVTSFAERLMTYALGRALTHDDMPVVRSVVRAAAKDDHTLRALVQAIVASDAFQKRMKTGDAPVAD